MACGRTFFYCACYDLNRRPHDIFGTRRDGIEILDMRLQIREGWHGMCRQASFPLAVADH